MTTRITFLLLGVLLHLVAVHGHNPDATEIPLREFHLKNGQHLHASLLLLRNDSVFLETSKGAILPFSIAAFKTPEQDFFRKKAALIAQINKTIPQVDSGNLPTAPADQSSILWMAGICFLLLLLVAGWKNNRKWAITVSTGGIALLLGFKTRTIQQVLDTNPAFIDAAFQPFKPHVATHWDDTWFYVESNGLPTTHSMMTGITKWQQQVPIPQCYIGDNAWQIPLNPELAAQPIPVNQQHFLRGAIAIAANGIPVFNPHTNTGVDAFLDGQLDQWGGHSGRADDYHYHIAPLFLDTQTVDILPIAFALDGFAVYGSQEPDGDPMLPLDANHGHFDPAGVYHYHGTPEAPYMIGSMVGKVTEDSTLQIIPQAKAMPVRPSLTPLNGAVITDFQPNAGNNGYLLTYTRNGQTYQVDYSWTPGGVYTYQFISPGGLLTQNYNGHIPCTVAVATGEVNTDKIRLFISPNPAQGDIFLKIQGQQDLRIQAVTLFDVQGQLVFHQQEPNANLSLGHLRRGLYFVKVQIAGAYISQKIIIQ